MKKITAYILLSVIILNGCLVYGLFFINRTLWQNKIKNEIKSKIESIVTERLSFPTNDTFIKKVLDEGEKEFLHNNSMYDIVKTERSRDSIIIYAVNDRAEKNLINEIASHSKKNTEGNKNLLKIFSLLNLCSVDNILDFNAFINISDINFSFSQEPIFQPNFQVFKPPINI